MVATRTPSSRATTAWPSSWTTIDANAINVIATPNSPPYANSTTASSSKKLGRTSIGKPPTVPSLYLFAILHMRSNVVTITARRKRGTRDASSLVTSPVREVRCAPPRKL